MVLQSDRKIIMVGNFTSYNGVSGTGVTRIVRVNPDGTIDSSFNGNASGLNAFTTALAVQTDGKIVI